MFLVGPAPFKKEMLSMEKCYMLDCGTEIFIWMGRNTSLTERKMSISVTEVRRYICFYMLRVHICVVQSVCMCVRACLFVCHQLVCMQHACIHLFFLLHVQILSGHIVYALYEVSMGMCLLLLYDYVLVTALWMMNICFCRTFCDCSSLYLCIFHLYACWCIWIQMHTLKFIRIIS